MLVLVTGATGFLGSHLVERLIAAGHQVRCLVRSTERLGWLSGLDVSLYRGDCSRPDTLAPAVRGVRTVYHLAGVTWAVRRTEYFAVNAAGTHNLLQACAQQSAPRLRFVFVSSQAAAGPARGGVAVREAHRPRPISPYGASKLLAERHVAAYADRLHCVILRPSTVYGPRDTNLLPYMRLAQRGFLIEFGRGDRVVSLCHIQDIVDGIVRAAVGQVPSGSVYFLADPVPYAWREVENAVRQGLGIDARQVMVPKWCTSGAASLAQLYGMAAGKPVKGNAARLAELLEKQWICDVSRAANELDFRPRIRLDHGFNQLIRWYRQQHWI